MSPRFLTRQLARELRGAGGRIAFFTLCLAVGVASVVGIASLSGAIDGALRREARQLLAADLKVESRRPLPVEVDPAIAALPGGAERADVVELVTVAAAPPAADGTPGASALVELKAVAGPYPFYGTLGVEPPQPLAALLADGGAVAAPDLLARLGLAPGGEILVGGLRLAIRGTVTSEPDRIAGAFSVGPRLFVSRETLERAGLLGRGSRAEYRALVRLRPGTGAAEVRAAAARLEAALASPQLRVETYLEAQPSLRRGLERAERFLGLVALLSLLVGGVGVAQTVSAWLAARLDAIAVLKCLGVRPREVLALYIGQTALLAAAGSAAGALAGVGLAAVAIRFAPAALPGGAFQLWQPGALARGAALGVGVALLFSLPPLVGLLRVPAARVLRRDAEPPPPSRWLAVALALVLALGVGATASAQSRSLSLGFAFTGALALLAALLWAAARGLAALSRRAPRRGLGVAWRYGLAALGRPGAATLGAVVSLGLGVMVVLALSLVQRQLSRQLLAEIPDGAPNAFLVDIQTDQWPDLEVRLGELGAAAVDSVPVVMARLAAIDGVAAAELAERTAEGRGGRRWALTREQRLTYLERLPDDNTLVAGALWADPERAELSVEEEFARDLGLALGSQVTFDIQGVPVELTVTSLRRVRWESFGINFFLVVEPGVLDGAPQQRLATARFPAGGEQRAQDALARDFPNVTLLQLRELLEKVATVMRRIGLGVRFLGGFTVVAGIAILAGAIGATSARRGREVALLKALGMGRRQVVAALALEYGLVGLVAGGIGGAAALLLSWAVLTHGMEVRWTFDPLPVATALAGTVLLAAAAGLAASLGALARRPVEALRQE